jgi:hypothetical protein
MSMSAHRTTPRGSLLRELDQRARQRLLLNKIDPWFGRSHPASWPRSPNAKLLKLMRDHQRRRLQIKHLYSEIFPNDPEYHDSESDDPFDPLPRPRPRPRNHRHVCVVCLKKNRDGESTSEDESDEAKSEEAEGEGEYVEICNISWSLNV